MIIRNCTTKTLKASSLNNRSVRRTYGWNANEGRTLKEYPISTDGQPF